MTDDDTKAYAIKVLREEFPHISTTTWMGIPVTEFEVADVVRMLEWVQRDHNKANELWDKAHDLFRRGRR